MLPLKTGGTAAAAFLLGAWLHQGYLGLKYGLYSMELYYYPWWMCLRYCRCAWAQRRYWQPSLSAVGHTGGNRCICQRLPPVLHGEWQWHLMPIG